MSSGLTKGVGPQFETVFCDFSQAIENVQETILPPIRFEVLREKLSGPELIFAPQVINYTKVLSKTGDFIDMGSGEFMAPIEGTYRFFFQCVTGQDTVKKTSDNTIAARINGKIVDKAHNDFNYNPIDNGYVHFVFTLALKKGDKVDVKLTSGAIYIIDPNQEGYGSQAKFAGELLY